MKFINLDCTIRNCNESGINLYFLDNNISCILQRYEDDYYLMDTVFDVPLGMLFRCKDLAAFIVLIEPSEILEYMDEFDAEDGLLTPDEYIFDSLAIERITTLKTCWANWFNAYREAGGKYPKFRHALRDLEKPHDVSCECPSSGEYKKHLNGYELHNELFEDYFQDLQDSIISSLLPVMRSPTVTFDSIQNFIQDNCNYGCESWSRFAEHISVLNVDCDIWRLYNHESDYLTIDTDNGSYDVYDVSCIVACMEDESNSRSLETVMLLHYDDKFLLLKGFDRIFSYNDETLNLDSIIQWALSKNSNVLGKYLESEREAVTQFLWELRKPIIDSDF